MNKNLFALRVILLFFTLDISFECNAVIPANRDIMIFNESGSNKNLQLTLSSNKIGIPGGLKQGITLILMAALYQEAAPIICTAHLIENIFNHQKLFKEFCTDQPSKLFEKYKSKRFGSLKDVTNFANNCKRINTFYSNLEDKYKSAGPVDPTKEPREIPFAEKLNSPEKLEIGHYLLCNFVPFERYIIRRIPNSTGKTILYLLVPRSYLMRINEEYKHEEVEKNENGPLQPIEKALGLKINHYDDTKIDSKAIEEHASSVNISADSITDIFVNKQELMHSDLDLHKNIYQAWAVYIMGHGNRYLMSPGNSPEMPGFHGEIKCAQVAGFSLPQFKNLMSFFNNQVLTSLVFYSSCYTIGKFADLFKKETEDEIISLNYAIATSSLSDSITSARLNIPKMYWNYASQAIFFNFTPYNFSKFFASLREGSGFINYSDLFSFVAYFKDLDGKIVRLSNVPSIRFPGTKWFNVIDIPKRIIELTKIRVLIQGTKPLLVNKTKEMAKDAILLYDEKIPFEINAEKPQGVNQFPAIVSMTPGSSTHQIESIEAKDYNLTQVLQAFFPFKKLASPKEFNVKKLTAKNDLPNLGISLDQVVVLNDVVIANKGRFNGQERNYIFFKTGDEKVYCAIWSPSVPPKDLKEIVGPCELDYMSGKVIKFVPSTLIPVSEKFSGIVQTTEGPEVVSVEKIIEALEKKKTIIEQTKAVRLEEMLNSLKNLNMQLSSLSARGLDV